MPTSSGRLIGPATPMQEVMYASAMVRAIPGLDIEHIEINCLAGISSARLSIALEKWAAEFETLRTGFEPGEEGGVVQVLLPRITIPLQVVVLDTVDGQQATEAITRHRNDPATQHFDLAAPPLVRVTLFQLPAGRATLVLTLHHLIYDGRCAADLLERLFTLYEDSPHVRKAVAARPSFGQFAAAVRAADPEAARPFFENLLTGFQGPPDLRLAPPHNISLQSPVGYILRDVSPSLLYDLTRAAKNLDVTLNTLFQLAWAVLLARYSGTADIVWGTTRACRHGILPDGNRVIGMCINTVPCRLNLADHPTLATAAATLRRQHIDIRPYEHTSPALVQRWCGKPGRLFNTLAVFERFVAEHEVTRRLSIATPRTVRIYSRPGFDLTAMLSADDIPRIELVYERTAVPDAVAPRVMTHLLTLLSAIAVAEPSTPLAALAHLPEPDVLALTAQGCSNAPSFPRDIPLHTLFEKRVDAHPDMPCLQDDHRTLTYLEVDRWANQLADTLRSHGIRLGMPIPVLIPRSMEYVIAVLAILKAGGAYVPLELTAPPARLAQAWKALNPKLAVCTSQTVAQLPTQQVQVLVIDRVNLSECLTTRNPAPHTELANIIFTSGSTGDPKGVMIPHRAIARLIHNRFLPFLSTDVYLLFSSIAFDASTLELWAPLLTGATLAISPEIFPPGPFDLEALRQRLRAHRVNRLWLTSTLFNAIIDTDPHVFDGVQTVLAGGEALSPSHVARAQAALPATTFINGYGPTESTTFTCTHTIGPVSDDQLSIPIGRPIDHTLALPLDLHGHPVDTGFAGELLIGGDGLAIGYLGDDELTAQRFITRTLRCCAKSSAHRLYRSGDLVRVLPNGLLDFVERLDSQIKLRGYRIDPGEIETALMHHPAVKNAAVVARGSGIHKQLLAFVVSTTSTLDAPALLRHLNPLVPEYMLPRHIVFIEQLPVTVNGKLDRFALDKIDLAPPPAVHSTPADETERRLQELFADVLGIPDPPLDEGIIELGFNSLSIVDLSLRLERAFGQRYSERYLVGNPMTRDLARLIQGESPDAFDRPNLLVSVGTPSSTPPLFLIPGIKGDLLQLSHLSKEISQYRQVYILRFPGQLAGEITHTHLPALAADLVHAVEAASPTGPIHLLGYSFGATVAYEMARQFHAKNRPITFLALIDPPTLRCIQSFRWQLLLRLRIHGRKLVMALPTLLKKLRQPPAAPILLPPPLPVHPEAASLPEWQNTVGPAGIAAVRNFLLALGQSPDSLAELPNVHRSGLFAFTQYVPPPYAGTHPIHLFVSTKTIHLQPHHLGWRDIIRTPDRLHIYPLHGDHDTLLNPINSAHLAQLLAATPIST